MLKQQNTIKNNYTNFTLHVAAVWTWHKAMFERKLNYVTMDET